MNCKSILSLVLPLCLLGCDVEPQLNVRLGWTINANSAGPIVADALDFYSTAGLHVDLRPGGLGAPALNNVLGGVDDIGCTNGIDPVLKAQSTGVGLRILAAFHQKSYHAFFVRSGEGLDRPVDWVGKNIGVKHASPTFVLYQALLARAGVSRSSVIEFPLGQDPLLFLQGYIDVYPGAITNEGVFFELEGIPVDEVLPSDFGIETYGTVCFVTDKFYKQNRDILYRFIEATVQGWKWASKTENEERVLDFLLEKDSKLSREKERLALRRTLKFVFDEGATVGEISSARVQAIVDYLVETGVIELDSEYSVTAAGIVNQ